eukprot:PITA_02401
MLAGINRLKYRLARIPGNGVGCCEHCPDEVTIEMVAALEAIKQESSKRARRKVELIGIGISSSQSELQVQSASIGNSSSSVVANKSITSSFFDPHTTPGSQPTLESFSVKKRKEADIAVRRFWYDNSLSFNYAKSYFYQTMVDAIASVGHGYNSSYNALRGEELDEELKCIKAQLESIKSSWRFTGKFTQGELSHPAITRFATNFLSLQSLLYEYQALRRMFCNQQWIFQKDSTKPKALSGKAFVFGDNLWEKVTEIVSFTEPHVKVLRLMDGEKPAMGYICEGMDRTKEAIKTFCKGDESKYLFLWQIINSKCDKQLHSPLHAAGAYLNPRFFHKEGSNIQRDLEVMRGVMICIEKMFPDQDIQDKINIQRDMCKEAFGMFGFSLSQHLKDNKMPSKCKLLELSL